MFDQSISDGTYTLFDMDNSYPAVSGNDQVTDSFQNTRYLNYTLQVGPGQTNDFMDFGTYIDPRYTFVVAAAYAQQSSAAAVV